MSDRELNALLATVSVVLKESGLLGGHVSWHPAPQNAAPSPFNEHTVIELAALAHRAAGLIARCHQLLDGVSAPCRKTIHQTPPA
jgi:hypothetical protein